MVMLGERNTGRENCDVSIYCCFKIIIHRKQNVYSHNVVLVYVCMYYISQSYIYV